MATRPASSGTVHLITLSGTLAALAVVLALSVRFPILSAAPFLLYEPSDVPLLIGAFRLRPGWVVPIAAVIALVLGIVGGGGLVGMASRFVGSVALALTAALVCRATRKQWAGRFIGTVAGILVYTGAEILITILLGPLFFGNVQAALQMIVPVIIPFNLLKGTINGALAIVTDSALRAVLGDRAD